jgi:hypothetical protein
MLSAWLIPWIDPWPVIFIAYLLELAVFLGLKRLGRGDLLDDSAQPLLPLAIFVGSVASVLRALGLTLPAGPVVIAQMVLFVAAMIRRRDVSSDVGILIGAHLFVTLLADSLEFTTAASWLALALVVGVVGRGPLGRAPRGRRR